MTNKRIQKPAPDLWLEGKKEAIRALKPDHKVDVTDAVMQRVAAMPIPKSSSQFAKRVVFYLAAAACMAGVVISSVFFVNHKASPVTSSNDLSASLIDVYEYCNGYEDYEYDDDDALYDNPMSYFL